MKIWLYQGDAPWAVAIKLATGARSAHVELQLAPDVFFSSTLETGPRITDFKGLFSQDMNDWRIIEWEPCAGDADIVRRIMYMVLQQAAMYGEKPTYNKKGIALDFLPVPLVQQEKDQYFCSQVVCVVLQSIGMFLGLQPALVDPGDMEDWLDRYLMPWQGLRFKINEGVQ